MEKTPSDKSLLDLWSEVVKLRDKNRCTYCGRKDRLNSHHIFSRSKKSTRYSLDNGITLCASCHTLSSGFSAHKTPAEFIEWVKEKKGLEWYERLREEARTIVKLKKQDLLDIKNKLEKEKERLNQTNDEN